MPQWGIMANDKADENELEPPDSTPEPQLVFITKPLASEKPSEPASRDRFPEEYLDIVDEPEELFTAEAKVSGKSSDEWRRRVSGAFAEWLGPRGGWILLVIVIVLWIWIT